MDLIVRVPARRGPAWQILGDDEVNDPNAEVVVIFVERPGSDGFIHMANAVMSAEGYDTVGEDESYGMLERALKYRMEQEGVW